MLPMRIVEAVVTPDGGELVLYQRGDSFFLQLDGTDLMGSRAHGSEEELARRALVLLGERPAPSVLIGGLGLGYTVRAALDSLEARPRAQIVVAEFFSAVVRWNGGVLAHLAGRPLEDRRVRVAERDVAELVAESPGGFDVILLDVDNGPDALTLERNHHLYTTAGLGRLHRALTPGGVLGIWSAGEDQHFAGRLRRAGFETSMHRVRARSTGKGERHVLFLGRRR